MAWYSVYVVELDDQADLGPRGEPSKPYLYVGITARTPEERFATHLGGGMTASKLVRDYGIRLRPDLYEQYKKANGEKKASRMELRVAEELRSQGFIVHCGKPGFFWNPSAHLD